MKRRVWIAALIAAALVAAGAATGSALFRAYPVRMSLFATMTRNYFRSWSAPKGVTTTELNPAFASGALASSRTGEPRRRGLAKLQPDAHLRALRAAGRNQHANRRQAQGAMHLRHGAVHEL